MRSDEGPTLSDRTQLAVETPCPAARLIRVAGPLDRAAAASVLRLVDAQLKLRSARAGGIASLVIDLDEVSRFERGGLESLRHAPYIAGRHGVDVFLSGCGGRMHLLPLRARRLLTEFRTFPSVEVAVQSLADDVLERATPEQRTPLDPGIPTAGLAAPEPARPLPSKASLVESAKASRCVRRPTTVLGADPFAPSSERAGQTVRNAG